MNMRVQSIDHVQLAMPSGREADARAFYEGLLGIPEAPKPANLAKRGGCWFERAGLIALLKSAGYSVTADEQRFYVSDPFGNRIELMEAVV